MTTRKQIRMTVDDWTDNELYGHETEDEGSRLVVADLELPREWLFEGVQLNLLLSESDEEDRLKPQHIVLEPDYLVDVTAICRCATDLGDAPAHHLLQKFLPYTASAAIQLGTVANQMLDDVVNAPADSRPDELYSLSLRKSFAADPLRFATVGGIDAEFSKKCRQHFDNIRQTMQQHPVENAQLETAFLCEALGIQGRMDLMSGDAHTIIELKSGKGGYTQQSDLVAYRYEHALQMALYKESLYYNVGLPYAQVQTLLFYSLYPALLDIHLGRNDIHRAIQLRNGIVHLERCLRLQPDAVFAALTLDDFNPGGVHNRFFQNYQLPPIQRLIGVVSRADALTRRYFMTQLAFVEREQALAKTGIEGKDIPLGKHGFADVWRTTAESRIEAGNLITHLQLTAESLETNDSGALIRLRINLNDKNLDANQALSQEQPKEHPYEAEGLAQSNFRPGDMVMLHTEGSATFYFPCIIEEITAEGLLLRLRYPQRDTSALDLTRHFSIQPAHADSTYSVIYQGLFAFLEAPLQRRDLLLGRRMPRSNPALQLAVPIADEELRDIILRAKQAEDYFLLVGPPGTGKTSMALRQMVVEFLCEESDNSLRSSKSLSSSSSLMGSLLLMAFTNRAVDEICQMLKTIDPVPDYVRIGPELAADPAYRDRTLSVLSQLHPTRQGIRDILTAAPIVVGTIASISASQELFLMKRFHTAIVDEASQVLEPQLLPLLCAQANGQLAIRKFIFIGDHKQLPAVVVQSSEASHVDDDTLNAIGLTDCRQSLFERLHRLALQQNQLSVLGMLHRQGRMHQDIAAFVSHHYYDGLLDIVPLPHQTGPLEWQQVSGDSELEKRLATHRLLHFDVTCPSEAGQKSNSAEADLTARIVGAFEQLCRQNDLSLDWTHRLGIIVPFRSQIQQLRAALAEQLVSESTDITIDTVERYQGSQRDIILFTTVVGAAWQLPILCTPVETEGQLIDRKLNVALTRARKQFILIGNTALLSTCKPYSEVINYIKHAEND